MTIAGERQSRDRYAVQEAWCRERRMRWDSLLQRCVTRQMQQLTLRELINVVQTLAPWKAHG